MNNKQISTIAAGAVLLLLSGFFPVWTISSNGFEYKTIRRHLYKNSNSIMAQLTENEISEIKSKEARIQIDYNRMTVEWLSILILTIVAVILLKDRPKKNIHTGFNS